MNFGLSDAYRLVKDLDKLRTHPVLDHQSIEEYISDSDDDLAKNWGSFRKYVAEALDDSEKNTDDDAFSEKLMYLRMHAISISTKLDNFIDTIDKVLKK